MNHCHILSLSAIAAFGLVFLPDNAPAQHKSLKDQITGTWTLAFNENINADGTKVQPFGSSPKGILGTGPVVAAQKQEAAMRRVQSSIDGFDIWLTVPKSPARPVYDLGASPDALIVHLIGGELVLVFDDAYDMAGALEILRSPIAASHFVSKDGKSRTPFALYVCQRSSRSCPRKSIATIATAAGHAQ